MEESQPLELIDLNTLNDEGDASLGGSFDTPLLPRRRRSGRFPIFPPSGAGVVKQVPSEQLSEADKELRAMLPDKRQRPQSLEESLTLAYPPVMADRGKIQRAKSISATLDIPFSEAYEGEPGYTKALNEIDKSWTSEAGTRFMRGIGNAYVQAGQAFEYLFNAPGAADTYIGFGRALQDAYIPKLKAPEASWTNFINPEWYATTVAEALPSTLSLIPAGIIGAYGGLAIGAAAGATTIGAFGMTALGALAGGTGATLLTRPIESAMEASQTFDDALKKGMSVDEAKRAADKVYYNNLSLASIDVVELAAAFTPLKVLGRHAPKALAARILATTAKGGVAAGLEGGEEALQTAFQQSALEGIGIMEALKRFNPEMKESAMVGAVFGVGLPVAGSTFNALVERVEDNMGAKLQAEYEQRINANLAMGMDESAARLAALDGITETPAGKAHVEQTMKELRDLAEGRPSPEITEDQKTAAIDEAVQAEGFVKQDIIADAEVDQLIESMASGEITLGDEETGAPAFISRSRKQELFDLGYNSEAVANMTPADADLIVQSQTTAQERAREEESIRVLQEGAATQEQKPPVTQAPRPMIDRKGELLVSEESYQEALTSFREKTKGLKVGIDPTVLADAAKIGSYHFERGLRTFAEWAKRMIADLGESIRSSLRTIWNDLKEFNAKLGEAGAVGDIKGKIRLTTGQKRIVDMIREDVALNAAFRKAQAASKVAFAAGKKEAMEIAKADMRDIVIKAKVKAEAFGFREGFKVAEKLTRKELSQAFKEDVASNERDRKAMVALIKDYLPPELRGKLLNDVAARATAGRQAKILDRVFEIADQAIKQELIDEIGDLKDYGNGLDIEYQKRIDELLGDINTKKISPQTIEKLTSLVAYADENGMPSGINPKTMALLGRLEMVQAEDMSIEDLRELRDIAKHLTAMGKLKRKLTLKYNARERAKETAKLLESTYNIDWEGGWASTAQYVHLMQSSPLRVATIADGWKRGKHGEMVRAMSRADTDAQWEQRRRVEGAALEIAALPEKIDWSDDLTNARITTNIYNMQSADSQVLTLMEKYGWKEIPELSESERQAIEIMRKWATMKSADIKAMWEETKNTEFVLNPDYIMAFKYENYSSPVTDSALLQDPYQRSQVEQGFGKERVRGVKLMPRIDVWSVFEQTIAEQEWYLNMQPQLDAMHRLVNQRTYLDKAGTQLTNYWLEYIDVVARRGWTATAVKNNQNPFNKRLKAVRGNITRGILGWRISTMIMQPLAVLNAMAHVVSEHGVSAAGDVLSQFAQTWIVPGRYNEILKGSKALQNRLGSSGEVAIADLVKDGKGRKGFMATGLGWMQSLDVRTAAGVQQGVENSFRKRGIENAHLEAETVMQLVSASSDVTLRPLILAKGETARTLLTFQTFLMNAWDILVNDLVISGVVKGDFKKKMAALIGIGIYIMADKAEKEVREFLYETIKGKKKKEKDWPIVIDALFGLMSHAPFWGQGFEMVKSSGGAADIPLNKLINDVIKGIVIPATAGEKTRGETIAKAAFKGAEAAAIIAKGVPGTSQAFDFLEGALFPEKSKEMTFK